MKTCGRLTLLCLVWITATSYSRAQGTNLGAPLPPPRNSTGPRGGVNPSAALRPATLPRGVSEAGEGVFVITSGRPLELAAQLLSRKLGVAVSFEEAAWMSSRDVVRAADIPGNEGVTSDNHPRGPLVPRMSMFTMIVPTTRAAKEATGPARIIENALYSHSTAKNPGEYRLVRLSESEYSIVADQVEDESGRKVRQLSPLDVRISFPEKDRSPEETLNLIYQSVRAAANINLAVLTDDRSSTNIRLGANNEVAREVLAKALRRPGSRRLSWSVRYDPEGKGYLIYFLPVEVEESVPGAGVRLLPLAWPKQ
jgi:hypothetical protein